MSAPFDSYSQRDVAAMTVVALIREGVIKRTPLHFDRALKALGLTYGDLTRAEQLAADGWKPRGTPTPSAASLAKHASKLGANPTKEQRRVRDEGRMCANDLCIEEVPGRRTSSAWCSNECRDDQLARDADFARTGRSGLMKWCTRCKVKQPVEEFRVTTNGSWPDGSTRFKIKSFCLPSERSYQASRYMSTKVEEDLNALGITLRVGDDMVGLACKDCGLPFQPGQRVVGEAELTHWLHRFPEEPAVPTPSNEGDAHV